MIRDGKNETIGRHRPAHGFEVREAPRHWRAATRATEPEAEHSHGNTTRLFESFAAAGPDGMDSAPVSSSLNERSSASG